MKIHPIYTEANNCQDCYKCVRKCPVKAIKVENDRASIINERCIYCGHCVIECPSEAKKVRDDLMTVNYFIEHSPIVVAALAPSYRTEFSEWSDKQMISAIKELGFTHVSETALGAEMVSTHVNQWMETQEKGVYFSSCCPTIVDLIHSYYPQHKHKITPITTPMLAHGKMLKNMLGAEAKVVFIGPCISKKKEAEKNPGSVDVVISFEKLRSMFSKHSIIPQTSNEASLEFYPYTSKTGSLYPIDGGMLTSLNSDTKLLSNKYMCFSGLDSIIELLDNLDDLNTQESLFLELMACAGGCVNGPVTTRKGNIALKRAAIINNVEQRKESPSDSHGEQSLKNEFNYFNSFKTHKYSPNEITDALKIVGKHAEKDELNCGGCGYESCKDFAEALLDDIAESTMCVSYMRQTARRQASLLMQKIPYAVVMVDDMLNIKDANMAFARMLGEDVELAYEHTPGLLGMSLDKIFPAHKYFSSFIKTGSELLEKDVRLNGQTVLLSIFTIQKQKLVCGIIHEFNTPEIIKSEIAKRSKQVIRQNLKTVQKIALLLGENASQTEAMLNSLVEVGDKND